MHILFFVPLKRALAASFMLIFCVACGAAPMSASVAVPASTAASDQQAVRSVVDQFGQKLQNVSLQAPRERVTQDLQQQYAPFVSADLLNSWRNDPSRAPGRVVSSPWPERIEITSITKDSDAQYTVTGNEIEVTSVELVNGGAAGKQPVRLTVEKQQGGWVITAYARAN